MIESWNDIVQTAMLGTDKRQMNEAALPNQLKQEVEIIKEKYTDKEETFFGVGSLVFNYRQCGVIPLLNKDANLPGAAPEEQVYATVLAHQVLADILVEESLTLLNFWLQWCSYTNKIALPEVLPALLEIAVKHKNLQQLVMKCAGKRGEWLALLNDQWKFGVSQTEEELWQTGSLEQRKIILHNTRKRDAAKGRELLQSVWLQENASTKAELLKQLAINIGSEDAAWLETLLAEKSEKVKESAAMLLKRIPSSSIVQQYWQALQLSVKIKDGKKTLGNENKSSLLIESPESLDVAIFKWGIEKLSNQKSFSDQEYIAYQLIKSVPPSFWHEWLQMDVVDIVAMFRNNKNKKYLPALGAAASLFHNAEWLQSIIEADEKTFYPAIFSLLPQQEQEAYALSFLASAETAPDVIEELMTNSKAEWSLELTKAILQFTATRPYQYHHSFYDQIVQLIPVGIIPNLEKCTPSEEYSKNIWSKTSTYFIRLLNLKLQTTKAFQ